MLMVLARKPSLQMQTGHSQNDKGLTGPVKWYDASYIPKGWQNN